MTIQISKRAFGNYKLTPDGKLERDVKAEEAKLDVSRRLKRRGSKKVKVVKRGQG